MQVTKKYAHMWQFYEGYGQTECTAGCSMSMPGDWNAGKCLYMCVTSDV